MCGILGVVTREAQHPWLASARICQMRDTLTHRGPDDAGLHTEAYMTFAQRRLSIIDVSGGSQPMPSQDRKLWVLNNGEIYNYQQLRSQLEAHGHRFATDSDTEVIIYAYRQYGRNFVDHLRGMFALAIWDSENCELILARDHAGQKPLYYAALPEGIVFASELKALVAGDILSPELNSQALSDYLHYTHIPGPQTIYQGVYKLQPGHILRYQVASGKLDQWRYWDWNRLARPTPPPSYENAINQLEHHLKETVGLHMVADVPLGVLLSGGVDSTAVLAMAVKAGYRPKTFTIGFNDASHDESGAAAETAAYFQTEHHQLILQSEPLEELAPLLARQYDEPFADSSMVPTYYVCKLARQHVTVAIGGDGGDEVFGGYPRYFISENDPYGSLLYHIPSSLRLVLHDIGMAVYPRRHGRMDRFFRRLKAERGYTYEPMMSHFSSESIRQLNINLPPPRRVVADELDRTTAASSYLSSLQYTDFHHYLPDDILTKTDRASMLNSLELRAPFLDPVLLNYAATLPSEWVYKKRIVKDMLSRHVPQTILNRPKQGFGIPLSQSFNTPYRAFVDETLFHPTARIRKLIDVDMIPYVPEISERTPEKADYFKWTLLMLELWLQAYY